MCFSKKLFFIVLGMMTMGLLISNSKAMASEFGCLQSFSEDAKNGGDLQNRAEIDARYTWNLKDIYENEDLWEKDFKWIQDASTKLKEYSGKLTKSGHDIFSCLQTIDDIDARLQKLHLYSSLAKDLDLNNQRYQAMEERVTALSSIYAADAAFIKPELLSMPESEVNNFIKNTPKLELYKHRLDDLMRTKAHTLSKEQEELLALSLPTQDAFSNIYGLFSNADIDFPTIKDENGKDFKLSHARYLTGMYSTDRKFRLDVYKGIYVPFLQYKNTLAAMYNGSIKAKIFNAKARKYNTTLEAALDENNIPVKVYDNLINTVNQNLSPLQRWLALKQKVLRYKEFHPYDTYVTLFPASKKKYTYDQAVEIVLKALKPLGDEYINNLKTAFANRWLDVYETKGKRSGAYSTDAPPGTHPYVMLNWSGELNDVFTLAHEMGHNMHSLYSSKNQPYCYSNYPIFLAEVASITNEALLMDYFIKNASTKEEKMTLLETAINNIRGTFYRQTHFAEFEKEVQSRTENGEILTADALAELFGKIYQKHWGDDMVVDTEEKYSWPRIHHFFYNFYVYQYATSLSAAEAVSQMILKEGKPAVERYMTFLKSGGSDYAITTLKKAGIDMTQPEPILAVTNKMNRLIDELETLMNTK